MKKILALILALICISAMFGCAPKDDKPENESKKQTEESTTQAPTEAPTEEPTEAPSEKPSEEAENSEEDENGVFTFGKMSITLPEGFQVEEKATFAMALSKDYPKIADNINFMKMPAEKIENFKEEDCVNSYKQSFGDIQNFKSQKIKVGEVPAYKLTFSCTSSGVKMNMIQLFVFESNNTYILTFTIVDGNNVTPYEDCIKTIKFAK